MSAISLSRWIRARKPLAGVTLAGAIALAVMSMWLALLPTRSTADAATVTVSMTAAKADAIINATSGSAKDQVQAVGDAALRINAALPFSRDSVEAPLPFVATGNDIEAKRALLCLTQAVYYEAGFEPLEGRRAVAQVVLNRLRHPAFPKSICGVVYQGASTGVCQFTFVCDGSLNRVPATIAWREAEQVARAALAGYVEASVGESTFYHADYVAPRWAPLLAKVTQIGQHIFYRWPGNWGERSAFTGRYIGEPRDPASLRPVARLTPAAMKTDEPAVASGPPIARAPDDVGGLLDTSKGWTLNIPGPDESGSSAARVLAAQQATSAKPANVEAAAAARPAAAKPVV
jgi:spore germination cell wall hydrolase CwlJ-like protein